MIIGELAKALGSGMKVYVDAASVADGGTVTVPLNKVVAAFVTSSNDAHIAAVTGISGNTITIGLADNGGNSVTTAETVYVLAFGQ